MQKIYPVFKNSFRFIFLTVSILWMELLLRCLFFGFGSIFSSEIIYTILFTIPIATALSAVCSVFNDFINKIVFTISMFALTCWYVAAAVYYTIFKSFLLLDKLYMATDVFTAFGSEAVDGFINTLPIVIAIFTPFVALTIICFVPAIFNSVKPCFYQLNIKEVSLYLLLFFATQFFALYSINISTNGILSPKAVYTTAWTPELSMRNFGVLTTLRLNIVDMNDMANNAVAVIDYTTTTPAESTIEQEDDKPEPEIVYSENILPIDFEQLIQDETDQNIADIHLFLSQREPTLKNEYTAMFEGKNLIFITAEGFGQFAVNKDYTPTLYKLANEGFVFNNFYNPLWWSSTIDGEFVATNGLYALSNTQAFYETADNLMPFTMGNMLLVQGYVTTAYHNHTYDYYSRDLTHPNMGYDYYGIGNGLEMTETWPESDLEMMELTIPDTLNGEKPFHNYYMTVSGHLYYTFDGNAMSSKNREAVDDLDMSEEAKAYIACHIELDNALNYILEELVAAGELENTVICLSGDHYPYGLSESTLMEFNGGALDEFELHASTLILWSGDMQEPILIDKVCSSVDILPTLLNLFGLEYDSRLLMGTDILSTAPGIALFSHNGFISDEGRYSAITDSWQPNTESEKDSSYAANIFTYLQQIKEYNEKIIMNDYYSYIFD